MFKRDRSVSLDGSRKRSRTGRKVSSENNSSGTTAPRNRRRSSVFLKKKVDVAVSLYPASLKDCQEAVENHLKLLLLNYSEGLGGIMLSFTNVKLKGGQNGSGRGLILNELPHIHYTAACDALVFRPHAGCELQGRINECFPSHIGILVLDYFNAMISSDKLQSCGYSYDNDIQKWIKDNSSLSTDDIIKFSVETVHECDGTVSLEGIEPSLKLLVEHQL